MKHHEYQIYYGGFKIKLKNLFWCKQCKIIYLKNSTAQLQHKKQQSNKCSNPKRKGHSPI